jgi:hypothetical protein
MGGGVRRDDQEVAGERLVDLHEPSWNSNSA